MEIKKPDDVVRKWPEGVAEKVDLSEGNDLTKQLICHVPRGCGKTTHELKRGIAQMHWTTPDYIKELQDKLTAAPKPVYPKGAYMDEICSYALPEIPSRGDIVEKIRVEEDYQYYCKKFCYEDGMCSVIKIQEAPFTFGEKLIQEIVKEVQEFYKDIQMKEECEMNDVNRKDIYKLAHNIRMLGGYCEIEMTGINEGTTTIEIPTRYVNRLRVQMPTTDFDKEGCCAMTNIPKVMKVETYNNKVVKVTFWDGTFTKSVCSDNDTFDEDVGITICLMKKMLGKDGNRKYNNIIRDIHKTMDENDKKKEALKTEKSSRKEKQRKVELKKAATKAKERQDQIDIQSTAMLEAMRRFHAETGDDLK